MTGREGEGDEDEVSEGQEETLEDYRREINEKYDEGEEKGVSNAEEKDAPDEPGTQGDSDGASGVGSAPAADVQGKEQTESVGEPRQSDEENPGGEGAKLEEGEPPARTAGEDLESMREHLNDKYPEDEKEFSHDDRSQPIAKHDHEDMVELDPSARKTDFDEQEVSETKSENSADEVETSAGNPGTPTENGGASAKEDVGWKIADEPEGHARKSDSDSNAPTGQEGSPQPEVGDPPAKSTGLEDSPIENTSPVKTIEGADYDGSPQRGESDNPAARTEAKGGGNHLPENEGSMSAKSGTPDAPKEGDHGGGGSEVELPMVRKASTYMESLALIIPERVIPEHENRYDVFEVRISRVSKPEEEYKVYMTHKPDYERAYLPIKHVGAEKGEEFYVKKPEKHGENSFARDYNSSKPKGLENTSLEWRDGRFVLKVDNTELALKEAKLRAQEGKVVLDAKLNDEEKNAVKIAKGIDGIEFRLKHDHAIVTSMKENQDGITVTYQRTQNDIPPHARLIEKPQAEDRKLEGWKHEFDIERNGIWIERSINPQSDRIPIRFSDENRIAAATYWASHEAHAEKWHQGDIGEAVARAVLEKSNFRTITEHTDPITGRVPVHKSEHRGMDGVVERGGKYYVTQVKHWLEPQKALDNAKSDLLAFRNSPDRVILESNLRSRLEGGIAVEVHWSYKKREAVIYTDYIKL